MNQYKIFVCLQKSKISVNNLVLAANTAPAQTECFERISSLEGCATFMGQICACLKRTCKGPWEISSSSFVDYHGELVHYRHQLMWRVDPVI